MKQVEMMWKILFIYDFIRKVFENIFNCNHRALKKKTYCSVWNFYSSVCIYI